MKHSISLFQVRSLECLNRGAHPQYHHLVDLTPSCLRLRMHQPVLLTFVCSRSPQSDSLPNRVFSVVGPVKEPAMPPVAGRDYSNLRMVLNQRPSKHGVGNEGIILCRDDECGDGDGIKHMAYPPSGAV